MARDLSNEAIPCAPSMMPDLNYRWYTFEDMRQITPGKTVDGGFSFFRVMYHADPERVRHIDPMDTVIMLFPEKHSPKDDGADDGAGDGGAPASSSSADTPMP